MKLTPADKTLLRELGESGDLGRDLQEFRRSARFLSSQMAKLLARYHRRWVAVYQREVIADGVTLSSVLRKIDEKGLPREKIALRFIDKDEPTLIL